MTQSAVTVSLYETLLVTGPELVVVEVVVVVVVVVVVIVEVSSGYMGPKSNSSNEAVDVVSSAVATT